MPSPHACNENRLVLSTLGFLLFIGSNCHAQAALLMEEPYGLFGVLNPTGHAAIYFARICAETPVKLRHCEPGEMGTVIARYQGIDGYDWIAIPVLPYLYSVESASEVLPRADRRTVSELRTRYREANLTPLGSNLPRGNLVRGGWTQLIGVAYDRRLYTYLFETSGGQDTAFIERMNAQPNRTHFHLLFNNCADFVRRILDEYIPHTFSRSLFPDGGITTPTQITDKLIRYGRKHPWPAPIFRIQIILIPPQP